eukprot:c20785_g1_i1.p1 GENE.c20785_g1_i1~~c20785_g1_i1.p1  ORF type:complete len:1005 (-),score=159.22 c20785_g1_i1:17-2926(-)
MLGRTFHLNTTEISLDESMEGVQQGPIPTEIGLLLDLVDINVESLVIGTLPTEIALLTHLKNLQFVFNTNLTGSIPTQLGNLRELKRIILRENRITGTIPSQIFGISSLVRLFFVSEELFGAIPSEIGSSKLKHLDLSIGSSSKLPSEIGRATTLTGLGLSFNNFSGDIPSQLGMLVALTGLDLGQNSFERIATQLGQLTRLTLCALARNALVGTIPSQFGLMQSLLRLQLYNNKLSGQLPSQIAALSLLRNLHFEFNRISGTLPSHFGQLTHLEGFTCHNNEISGSIPSEIGLATNLRTLFLSFNNLTGGIPSQLGKLTNLNFLVVSQNYLSGTIPTQIGMLDDLQSLFLDANNFEGSIPSEIGQLGELGFLSLRENRLSGFIPSEFNQLLYLELIDMSFNGLTGTYIPLGPSLINLVLHHNHLSGTIPSEIGGASELRLLALFDNHLSGSVPPLFQGANSIILLSDNRLSCPLPPHSAPDSVNETNSQTLIALGNSHPLVGWGNTGAAWLGPWDTKSIHLFVPYPPPWVRVLGLLGLVVFVGGVLCTFGQKTWLSVPRSWVYCLQMCICASLVSVARIVVFGTAEHHVHQCPTPMSMLSLAESTRLGQSRCIGVTLLLVGEVLCSVSGVVLLTGPRLRMSDLELLLSPFAQAQSVPSPHRAWKVLVVLGWALCIFLFSVPMIGNFIISSFPANNSLGIRKIFVQGLRWLVLPLLVMISEVAIPALTKVCVDQYYRVHELQEEERRVNAPQHGKKRLQLILVSQMLVLVVLPVLTQLLFRGSCMRLGRSLWQPCERGSTVFDISVWSSFGMNVTILTQDAVCQFRLGIYDPEMCVRGVIETTSALNIFKVITQAAFVLLRACLAEVARNFRARLPSAFVRVFLRPVESDSITQSIASLMLLGLVYGGVAPLIWPAILVGIASTIVLWFAAGKKSEARTAGITRVLWLGVFVQLVLSVWFFSVASPCRE